MEIRGMGSCVTKEMVSVGGNGSPEKVVLSFCQKSDTPGFDYVLNRATLKGVLTLNAFYIFTGCVEEGLYGEGIPRFGIWPKELKAFIEKEGLGVVLETEKKQNPLYPPPHRVQVFVWSPNQEKLQAWWEAKDPEVLKRKETYVEGERKHAELQRERIEDQRRRAAAIQLDQQRQVEQARARLKEPLKAPQGEGLQGVPINLEPLLKGDPGARPDL